MGTTSHHTEHEHVSKILEWGLDASANFAPALYGCTGCDATSSVPFNSYDKESPHASHTKYTNGCFRCKVETLQLSTGDAASNRGMAKKKWDGELKAYKDARAQGIQPAGTSMKAVREAVDKSDRAGKAFDANTGGFK